MEGKSESNQRKSNKEKQGFKKNLVGLSLERLRPVVIETRVQVRCTASRPSQTQDDNLVNSEYNIRKSELSVNSSKKQNKALYLHHLQFVFVSHGLITLFRFRHLYTGLEQQREATRGSQGRPGKRTQLWSKCRSRRTSCGTVITIMTHLSFVAIAPIKLF